MEKEPQLTHEEHLEIMIEKWTQEIASCQACECPGCQRSIHLWEEKILQAMEELEYLQNGR